MSIRLLSSFAALAVGATMMGTAAVAADIPMKAAVSPQVYAPSFNWTGFYVGGHVGAGWGKGDTTSLSIGGVPTNFPIAQTSVSGFLGGVQVGYNWQVSPLFVVGVEGDFSWADIDGTSACLVALGCSGKAKWLADFTGRIGVTAGSALIYLKGGIAWADTEYSLTVPGPGGFTSTASDTRTGALLGTGIEYAFARNWSAKVEYNYIDFGSEDVTFTLPAPIGTAVSSIDQQLHLVKAGVNYRW